MVTSINMGIIISNFIFHELSFRDDEICVKNYCQVPNDDNQLIINMFDGHNYDKCYDHKSYNCPHLFKSNADQHRYLMQQICNDKHIIFQLQSSVRGKFCVIIQCPTLISIKKCKERCLQ